MLAERAGFPSGAVNIVTGDPAGVGGALTSSPAVRKLSFTGEGCIDFAGIIERMPPVDYSIELPNQSRVTELGFEEHARRCLQHAKRTFGDVRSQRRTHPIPTQESMTDGQRAY
ncbi:aldehyde dehydrogenase family protein [Phaeobacter inhibens]|uniref:aldehyde dehydrogenase family protein n=1 Tax=Phaeobacter inhibens TaxID=221822 RepID=UPI0001633351|nr:aldehyde dehydrogenase family protein [Phaeobacter inhibens]AFO91627.1 aldehyde dehydrogenase-like protein [Phaeobacter inhibens DSM 17395]AUQ46296.1 aldehyde dehydrogenase-like protein [Phaeobacter inhibens]